MFTFKTKKQTSERLEVFKTARQAIESKKIGSVLASNSLSSGDIRCQSGLKIDGRHYGDLFIENSADFICWVSPVATIVGSVVSPTLYVEGTIKGTVYADRVVVLKGGFIDGDAVTAELHLESGGSLRGEKIRTLPGEYLLKAAEICSKFPTYAKS